MLNILKKNNVDDEWAKFITSDCDGVGDEDDLGNESDNAIGNAMSEIVDCGRGDAPKSGEIYISTKSKIAYLNSPINLIDVFWKIPVIPYARPSNGVIKKQMKFNSTTIEEVDDIQLRLKNEQHFDQHIITSIDNPSGRIKFKDVRKISVGVSKKDIMSYRTKVKSAFYNCFVMIMRIKILDVYKEFHIKVFNTGKLEIPGIPSDVVFDRVLDIIIEQLQPCIDYNIEYKQCSDTVLINSNFNCGFYINRESLFDILKFKYNIQCIYDPCSYPGIQCKFYYNPALNIQSGSQLSDEEMKIHKNIVTVSFMIFRTGSILIVGMCDEKVLYIIYEFIKRVLITEFSKINHKIITSADMLLKDKKKKIRKKIVLVDIHL